MARSSSDSSDDDRSNRHRRHDRGRERRLTDDSDRDREKKKEREIREKIESKERSDEEKEPVEKKIGTGDGRRERNSELRDRDREYKRRSSDDDRYRDGREREREKERTPRDDNGHGRREVHDSRDRYRDERKSERGRDRTDDNRHRRRRDGDEDEGDYERRMPEKKNENDRKEAEEAKPAVQGGGNVNKEVANLGRSGGVYIPPFKLARMLKEFEDKSSIEYQRLTWDALRKSINGLVNKVNATNIKNIIPELFSENLIRGRGLFCRSCMKSQMASPTFTDVFAALIAVMNTKFPEVGELLLRRIVLQLKRAYKRNDKPQLLAAVKFIAHLVNQLVAHEIIALELLAVLLENPTDDSVEVAVGFVTECGSLLQDVSPKGLDGESTT